MKQRNIFGLLLLIATLVSACQPTDPDTGLLSEQDRQRIVLLGGSLVAGMEDYGFFESAVLTRYAGEGVRFRNIGWPADDVYGLARSQFGSAQNTRGYERMSELLLAGLGIPDPSGCALRGKSSPRSRWWSSSTASGNPRARIRSPVLRYRKTRSYTSGCWQRSARKIACTAPACSRSTRPTSTCFAVMRWATWPTKWTTWIS